MSRAAQGVPGPMAAEGALRRLRLAICGLAVAGLAVAGVLWLAAPASAPAFGIWAGALTGTAVAALAAALAGRAQRQADTAVRAAEQAVARLEDAIEALPAGFELFDADDRLVLTNSTLRQMHPLTADLLPQQPTFEERVRAAFARGGLPELRDLPGGIDAWIAQRREARRRDHDALLQLHGNRWLRIHERRTREGGVVGVRIDVTETVRQTQAAEQARARLHDAIEALPDGFALYDADDRLAACNTRYREIYAASAPVLVLGTPFEAIVRYGLERGQYPQALGREEAWLADRLRNHRRPPGVPLLQELPGNRWLQIHERVTHDGGVAGVRSDVTEFVRREQQLNLLNAQLDAANAQLAALSDTDGLTGIANRRRFDRALAEEGARAARHGLPLAVLMIDVDHFKPYNDLHGHVAGDAALRRVAALLAGCARRPGDLAARYGGEEFVLLLPHAGPDEALAAARLCLAAVDEAAVPHGASPVAPHVTLSIGVQAWRPGGAPPDPQALVQGADAAMYEVKRAGRHGVHLN